MISIEEAQQRLHQQSLPTRTIQRPLEQALSLVLAEPIYAREPSPRFTNSAMDGFAFRFADYQELGTQHAFSIVGESAAGHPYTGPLPRGSAVKISTGAPLPPDSDTVVPIEYTQHDNNTFRILSAIQRGANVKREGTEFPVGALLLPSHTLLLPPHLALLASQGITHVTVYEPPTTAIIVSGDELVPYTTSSLQPGQIRDSNSLLLQYTAQQAGARITMTDRVPDDLDRTIAILQQALQQSDILITSGGVSVGEHDHIRAALRHLGFEEIFWKVQQKPGKPFLVACRDQQWCFGLPGNPVSAYLCFVHYVYPFIRRWYHHPTPSLPTVVATLTKEMHNPQTRTLLLRVRLERHNNDWIATPLARQASYMLTSIAQADGYFLLPPNQVLNRGDRITVYCFPTWTVAGE